MYKELFLKRWKEMEDSIVLERESGETTFLEKDVFPKFFTSPELLVGFYIWRGAYGIKDGYYLFMEEYDGWIDDCKEIASQAKEIFEREMKENVSEEYKRGYEQALKDINTPRKMITETWNPSECPRCKETFCDYESCNDGYYKRATSLERCPYCGQKIEW